MCGLGNRKNAAFLAEVRDRGRRAVPVDASLRPTPAAARRPNRGRFGQRELRRDPRSGRGGRVCSTYGSTDWTQHALRLPGKPDPALFLEATRRLDVEPSRAAVVEDALAGVEAGRREGFGLVVGVDRAGSRRGPDRPWR